MSPSELKFLIEVITGVGLITIIIFTFIISSIIHQRKIIRLHEQLLKAEIDILEKERKRIAADLHDELGPILSSVKLYLNSMDPNEPDELKILEKSRDLLDTAIGEIRQISHNLMPVALQDRGLNDAVHQLVNHFNDTKSKSVHLQSEIAGLQIDKNIEITAFRIIQELLNNIIRHSQASEVNVQMRSDGKLLKISVEDNGIGFKREEITGSRSPGSGLGLKNIISRVNLLNGKLIIDSKPGKGTSVFLNIPLKLKK